MAGAIPQQQYPPPQALAALAAANQARGVATAFVNVPTPNQAPAFQLPFDGDKLLSQYSGIDLKATKGVQRIKLTRGNTIAEAADAGVDVTQLEGFTSKQAGGGKVTFNPVTGLGSSIGTTGTILIVAGMGFALVAVYFMFGKSKHK